MDPDVVKNLKDILNDFLDNPEDKDLLDDYIKMLKERSVYTFISVLHRIKYSRINELLDITNELVKVRVKDFVIQEDISTDSSTTDTESQYSSSNSSEEPGPSHYTGSMFDALIDE